jgi:hypothetical protein
MEWYFYLNYVIYRFYYLGKWQFDRNICRMNLQLMATDVLHVRKQE